MAYVLAKCECCKIKNGIPAISGDIGVTRLKIKTRKLVEKKLPMTNFINHMTQS